jgi:hypothetical protein
MQTGAHIQCLDVIKILYSKGSERILHDCAILLEVWEGGGLLQSSVGIPEGSMILLESVGHGIRAKVLSSEQDRYGFLIQIEIQESGWFPDVYMPPHVILA